MKTVTYDETEWQMVPKVPTEEMKDAAMDILLHHGDIYANSRGNIVIESITPADLLRAMLRAAPTPPADGQARPVVNQQMTTDSDEDDQTLADTQRAIIEAAEQRGYARAKSECGQGAESQIPAGWVFHFADFSMCEKTGHGTVMLMRDKAGTDAWHKLTEEMQETTDLYATGDGATLREAIEDATRAAKGADHG